MSNMIALVPLDFGGQEACAYEPTDPRALAKLRQALRCLAKTRRGTLCQSPQTKHGRCRLHGGAPGTGAPSGKRNGSWKHGSIQSGVDRAAPADPKIDAGSPRDDGRRWPIVRQRLLTGEISQLKLKKCPVLLSFSVLKLR